MNSVTTLAGAAAGAGYVTGVDSLRQDDPADPSCGAAARTRRESRRGWRVIAIARDPAAATELQALAKEAKNVVVEKLDVTDHPGIDALAAKYAGRPINILINNAGLMSGPAEDRGSVLSECKAERVAGHVVSLA